MSTVYQVLIGLLLVVLVFSLGAQYGNDVETLFLQPSPSISQTQPSVDWDSHSPEVRALIRAMAIASPPQSLCQTFVDTVTQMKRTFPQKPSPEIYYLTMEIMILAAEKTFETTFSAMERDQMLRSFVQKCQ